MSLTGVAALIAAVSFAVLACAGVYLAVRLTRVLGDAATLVRETRDGPAGAVRPAPTRRWTGPARSSTATEVVARQHGRAGRLA